MIPLEVTDGPDRRPAPPDSGRAARGDLSRRRLAVLRGGYAFVGVGLAVVKWPVVVEEARALPVMDGVVACLLTAVSLLALLGLRHPVRMLPILLLEAVWKAIWFAAVAVPHLVVQDLGVEARDVLINCSLVVVVVAVVPWRFVWARYIR